MREVLKTDYKQPEVTKHKETNRVEQKKEKVFVAPQSQGGCFFSLFSAWRAQKESMSFSEKKTVGSQSECVRQEEDLESSALSGYHRGSIYAKDSFGEANSDNGDKYVGKPNKHKKRRTRKPQI